MHPFIHPLTSAADPAWDAKSDWDIFKGIAKKFSELAPEKLGVEKDVVLVPILHDTPGELAQSTEVKEWKKVKLILFQVNQCQQLQLSSVIILIYISVLQH